MAFMRGEAVVSKIAMVAKYGVLPGAMIAALIYSPPSYSTFFSSSKKAPNKST